MKKLFATLFAIGFIIAIGTATTSDIEAETRQRIMTDEQFATRIIISLCLVSVGGAGMLIISNKQTKEGVNRHGRIYPKKVPNYATVGNTYYTRTNGTLIQLNSRKHIQNRNTG